jgi:hypothetical protein
MFLKLGGSVLNLNAIVRVEFLTLRSRFCARVQLVGESKRQACLVLYDADARALQRALGNLAVNGGDTEPSRAG